MVEMKSMFLRSVSVAVLAMLSGQAHSDDLTIGSAEGSVAMINSGVDGQIRITEGGELILSGNHEGSLYVDKYGKFDAAVSGVTVGGNVKVMKYGEVESLQGSYGGNFENRGTFNMVGDVDIAGSFVQYDDSGVVGVIKNGTMKVGGDFIIDGGAIVNIESDGIIDGDVKTLGVMDLYNNGIITGNFHTGIDSRYYHNGEILGSSIENWGTFYGDMTISKDQALINVGTVEDDLVVYGELFNETDINGVVTLKDGAIGVFTDGYPTSPWSTQGHYMSGLVTSGADFGTNEIFIYHGPRKENLDPHSAYAAAGERMIVNGDVVLDNSAKLNIYLDEEGNTDSIEANGTVQIGGLLNIQALGFSSGYVEPNYEYLLILNDGIDPITGDFGEVVTNWAFLEPELSKVGGDGNDLVLTLINNNYDDGTSDPDPTDPDNGGSGNGSGGSGGNTSGRYLDLKPYAEGTNAVNVAVHMDSYDYDSDDGTEIYDAFLPLSEDDVPGAIDMISGKSLAGLNALSDRSHRHFMKVMTDKSKDRAAFVQNDFDEDGDERDRRVWAEAYAGEDKINGSESVAGVSVDNWGLAGGLRFDGIGDGIGSGGVGFGYSRSDFDMGGRGEAISDNFHIGFYSAFGAADQFSAGLGSRFAGGYTYNMFDTKRKIVIGTLDRTADGDFDGYSVGVDGEFRYGLETVDGDGALKSLVIAPLVGFQTSRSSIGAYDESGAGSLNILAENNIADSFRSRIGFELGGLFSDDFSIVRPSGSFNWIHEFGDVKNSTTYRLAGATDSYVIETPKADRDSLEMQAGLDVQVMEGLSVYAGGLANWGADDHVYRGNVRATYQF